MRWVHLLGLGFVIGFTALGFGASAMLFRWNEIAYPEKTQASGAQPAAQRSGGSPPPDAAQGQTIFQQKCASCHKIGGGKLVGPDLKGITQQRPRDFLIQMITNPEAALQTPTGQQLLKDYGAPMPNVGVTPDQANQILAYIDFQSGGAAPAQPGAQPSGAPAPQASPGAPAPAGTPAPGAAPAPAPGGAPAGGDPAKGKAFFDQNCSPCHTIGGGKKVGPDLKGVTSQQSHDWLVNMITQPDKWTQSDPTAKQLLQQYGVQMPNLGVPPATANDVIAYIQQQSGGASVEPPSGNLAERSEAPPSDSVPLMSAHRDPSLPSGEYAAAPLPMMATAHAAALFDWLAVRLGAQPQQTAGDPNQGKPVFDQNCGGCHPGGDKGVGPALKGANLSADVIRTTVRSGKGAMPAFSAAQISDAQLNNVVAYVQQLSGGGTAPPAAAPAPAIKPGDAGSGRALFTGEKRLGAGGPACIACHNAEGIGVFRGGTWGVDLTKEQSKLGTDGIVGALKSPAFPGMKEAFANHPIADGEAADLAAFFIDVDKQEPSGSPDIAFPLVGVVAFLIMVGIAWIAWRGRTLSVRKRLVGGTGR